MKKIISGIIVLVSILFIFFYYSSKKINLEELKSHDTLMFQATIHNFGENDYTTDFWTNTTYKVYYDGKIEICENYNLSGEKGVVATISDKEYEEIYKFASTSEIQVKMDGADGVGWEFHYYDLEGNHTLIYDGYTYGMRELERIQEILDGYHFVD